MLMKDHDYQLLKDAEDAGFKVFNGSIHLPAACEVMYAFQAFAIIRENRAIAPLVIELDKFKQEKVILQEITGFQVEISEPFKQ